jgi:hypothetical protein
LAHRWLRRQGHDDGAANSDEPASISALPGMRSYCTLALEPTAISVMPICRFFAADDKC